MDVGESRETRVSVYRSVLGMPGPVWTLALWYGAIAILLALSLLVPLRADAAPIVRQSLMGYALVGLIVLLVLRARTPMWFLQVQIALGIVAIAWLVYASVTAEGTLTSSMAFIVMGIYVAFWMTIREALGFAALASVAYFVALLLAGNIPDLAVPWMFITAISFGVVLTIGLLVEQMNRALVTDPLTGLLNRTGMFAFVEARGVNTRLAEPRALVVIDLDGFKEINDRDGHIAGDRTLRDFGRALRVVARPRDVVVRSGGDEFVLLLPRTDVTDAEALVARLRGVMPVEWSCGITQWTGDEPYDLAWARADRQMYIQKALRATEA